MNKRTGRLCGNTAVLQENNINFYDGSKCFPMKRWGKQRVFSFTDDVFGASGSG